MRTHRAFFIPFSPVPGGTGTTAVPWPHHDKNAKAEEGYGGFLDHFNLLAKTAAELRISGRWPPQFAIIPYFEINLYYYVEYGLENRIKSFAYRTIWTFSADPN